MKGVVNHGRVREDGAEAVCVRRGCADRAVHCGADSVCGRMGVPAGRCDVYGMNG